MAFSPRSAFPFSDILTGKGKKLSGLFNLLQWNIDGLVKKPLFTKRFKI